MRRAWRGYGRQHHQVEPGLLDHLRLASHGDWELFPFCLDTVPMTGSTALGVQLSKTDAAAWMARLTASSRDGTEPSGRYISGVSWFVLAPPGSHARYVPN